MPINLSEPLNGDNISTVEELDEVLSHPSERLVHDLKNIDGDFIVLGLGGKMGPSLGFLLSNACRLAGRSGKIFGVSRFSNQRLRSSLEQHGVTTISGDLLDDDFLLDLPEAKNVIYMAGNKFGTSGNESYTWAMNSFLPGRVAGKFKNSRIVVFSSGNIYPFVDVRSGGATELTRPDPIGEYAQSCLGRERIFEYFSLKNGTQVAIYRLNYALDLRYGILLEIGKSVWNNRIIDLTTGYVNVIWQGDANEFAIRSLLHCSSPAKLINITGPDLLSVKWIAEEFGKRMRRKPEFVNVPAQRALLNNATHSFDLFGKPRVSIDQMIEWTANWIINGGEDLGKPTHFQERKGVF